MSSKPKPCLKVNPVTQRLKPIRATQPFQLRQGSPARKSPSSSPTSMLSRSISDPRRNRWLSEHRNSPDRKSSTSPSIKVSSRRSPSPRLCRTSSIDPVPAYLTGQWLRDPAACAFLVPNSSGSNIKSTQTPLDWYSESVNCQSKVGGKSLSSRSVSCQDAELKHMKRQMRRIAKTSRQEKKERQSPIHANHSALPHSQVAGKDRSISNPVSIYGRVPRRQNSLEGLNKEIEYITIKGPNYAPQLAAQGITTPDGHRAPFLPRSSTTRSMETQTPQGFAPSPNYDQTIHIASGSKADESGYSPCQKYASSPRPNNSYMFKREPPEGAESVKPFKEQDIQHVNCSSCPDKEKINFQVSQNGSFKKWRPITSQKENDNGGLLHSLSLLKVKVDTNGMTSTVFDSMGRNRSPVGYGSEDS